MTNHLSTLQARPTPPTAGLFRSAATCSDVLPRVAQCVTVRLREDRLSDDRALSLQHRQNADRLVVLGLGFLDIPPGPGQRLFNTEDTCQI